MLDDSEDPTLKKFTVTNPTKKGQHYQYTITGVDNEGEFTELRRYKEFFQLCEGLK